MICTREVLFCAGTENYGQDSGNEVNDPMHDVTAEDTFQAKEALLSGMLVTKLHGLADEVCPGLLGSRGDILHIIVFVKFVYSKSWMYICKLCIRSRNIVRKLHFLYSFWLAHCLQSQENKQRLCNLRAKLVSPSANVGRKGRSGQF